MKIVDKTPYRSETGEIDILGRLQGTLKYGLTWYNRIQSQDVAIAGMEKQLGNSYTLLRNITLPNTEINLPLVLVGPPGVYLINVTHETGVYSAKDDEWGTIAGDRFVPARINQISRTLTFGRVLQVYLDRQGFKGMFAVDAVLMATDPGMHIESTRPAVRIVMSDALERFAASLGQGRLILNAPTANDIVQALLVGRTKKIEQAPAEAETSSFGGFTEDAQAQSGESFSSDYTFDDQQPAEPVPGAATQAAEADISAPTPSARPRAAGRSSTRKRGMGVTRTQWIILISMVVFWLCVMAVFFVYILSSANA